MENRSLSLTIQSLAMGLGVALIIIFVLSLFVQPKLLKAQSVATNQYIGVYVPLATLTSTMPATSVATGTLALTTDTGLVYSNGTSWTPVYPRFAVTSGSIGGSLLALGGCTADAAVSIPTNATTFDPTPLASLGGGFTINKWLTSGVAHFQICAPVVAGTPTATAFNVKAFP